MTDNIPQREPAEFELIQRVLREVKAQGRSSSLQAWAVDAQAKLTEYRTAGGLKVKKECDAVEKGLKSSEALIELLRTAAIKQM